ncbi:MAG: hypothetical protein Kow0075_03550 [Salibacteraceae bacterium]
MSHGLSAQTVNLPDSITDDNWYLLPKISVGVGMLNYRGDLMTSGAYFNPFQNRGGVHVAVSQTINSFLDLQFYMLFGSVGADERSLVRNLNFRSRITTGGVSLVYNFDHFLKPDRVLEPFISVGVEAVDFESKTDLIDSYGNVYHYWSDGSIRNVEETSENIKNSVIITRDYVYETDIRYMNADGFGDYPERTLAIPVGGGFNMRVNPKTIFTMGLEYHWTFSDYIDGITPESRGNRAGNPQTDRFLHTFARLTFDLTPIPRERHPETKNYLDGDSDRDSIPDFADLCPKTPLGLEVDKDGCPIDTDGDGVPDYLDAELNSPEGAIVDTNGVALSDADLERMYLEWNDMSGKYSMYTNESYSLETVQRKTKRRKTSFVVKIGEFEEAIDDSLANVLLSNENVSIRQDENGKTIIEMTGFESLPEAVKGRINLESQGIATEEVVAKTGTGKVSKVSKIEQDMASREVTGLNLEQAIEKNKSLPPPEKPILKRDEYTVNRPIDPRSVTKANDEEFGDKIVYRVQVGAYANKLNVDIFDGIDDLLVITTSDGLTRYYVGAFTNYQQAASLKIDMMKRGYEGAYIVPFKNGQRISLKEAGATPAENVVKRTPQTSPYYGKVKFKVQIGAYSGQIPTDLLDKMMGIGKIDQRSGEDGKVRYFAGEFNTYEEALAFKQEMIARGFTDAFVAAEYNGKIITATEGINLLK